MVLIAMTLHVRQAESLTFSDSSSVMYLEHPISRYPLTPWHGFCVEV